MSNQYGFRHGPTNTNTPAGRPGNGVADHRPIGNPGSGVTDDSTVGNGSSDVTQTVATAAHKAVDAVTEKAAKAEAKLREGAASNEEALREAADKAALKANELKSQASRYVTEKPFAAAGIAFLAGIVTAAWMRR